MKRAKSVAALCVVMATMWSATIDANAQVQAKDSRLRNDYSGTSSCLDIVNDGKNNTLQMAKCGNFAGQSWTSQPTSKAGYSRLRTEFTGADMCLDIVNDGKNNKLKMAKCADVTGQYWSAEAIGDTGKVRLRNVFSGPDKCLDVVTMAKCGNYSGQSWNITKAGR